MYSLGSICLGGHRLLPGTTPPSSIAHHGREQLEALRTRYPEAFHCACIRELREPPDSKIDVIATLSMHDALIAVAGPAQAISTGGVSGGIAICFRGQNAAGQAVLGLAHYASCYQLLDFVAALRSSDIAGGEILLVGGALDRDPAATDALDAFSEMLDLLTNPYEPDVQGFRLTGARAGLSQTELQPGEDAAQMPDLGRPRSVTVTVTHDAVLYRHDEDEPFEHAFLFA